MANYLNRGFRIAAGLVAGLALAGCGSTFSTAYDTAAPPAARADWRVTDVRIVTPANLTTTEQNSFIPKADVVWHGDPAGNRIQQAAAIVKRGVEQGLGGLRGRHGVIATVTLRRFHSETPKAYFQGPAGSGVHSVAFDLTITDARTGAVLAGPQLIKADLPATGAARDGQQSNTLPSALWKKQISDHIAATVRGWSGTGPDIRGTFSRLGA